MAKIINKINIRRFVRMRNKALSNIDLNNNYLDVAKEVLEEKHVAYEKKRTIQMKRRLIQLEKRAASQKVLAREEMAKELGKLNEKQRLPKLAVEQSYLRKAEKLGKKGAGKYKKVALEKLNDKEVNLRKKWEDIIKQSFDKADAVAVKVYNGETKSQKAELDKYTRDSRKKADAKYAELEQRIKISNANLEKQINHCNEKIADTKSTAQKTLKSKETILQIEELEMRFGGVKAVDKLSFEVKEGEIFGLIGPNGAGKTTVFNCITQFNKPMGGSIYYRNGSDEIVELGTQKVHNIIKTGIVRTFQNLELIWELSVLDNMLIGAQSLYSAGFFDHILHTRKLKREEKIMRLRAVDVLQRLNLIAYKDGLPLGLPYGILKKIELARTLMVHPRLIILDEPAAGLNEAETAELAETINKIRKDYGCTIFLVEHDMGLVMEICDTVCAISFGKMLAIGTPEQIQTNALVQEAYLGGTMTED